jgi:hypothetical protein
MNTTITTTSTSTSIPYEEEVNWKTHPVIHVVYFSLAASYAAVILFTLIKFVG